MKTVNFIVPGPPKGKGRPRFSNAGNYVRTYTPKETANYENLVVVEYQSQCNSFRFDDEQELSLFITAIYEIPKSVSKTKRNKMISGEIRPTKKPDIDNVIKIIADSLNGVAYRDDSQIVRCHTDKIYGSIPMVVVSIADSSVEMEELANENYEYENFIKMD